MIRAPDDAASAFVAISGPARDAIAIGTGPAKRLSREAGLLFYFHGRDFRLIDVEIVVKSSGARVLR